MPGVEVERYMVLGRMLPDTVRRRTVGPAVVKRFGCLPVSSPLRFQVPSGPLPPRIVRAGQVEKPESVT